MAALLAGACGEREVILPGERFDTRVPLAASLPGEDGTPAVAPPGPENRSEPIALPAPQQVADWTHRGGGVDHRAPHASLSAAPALVLAANIGQGDNRRFRIATAPVIAGGAVYTMDSRARVQATSTGGQALWTADLTPPGARNAVAGGGLAVGGGRVLATTAFGELVALDPASGAVVWRQRLDTAATGAPTVANGVVHVAGRDNRAWAVDLANGRVLWTVPGTASPSGVTGPAGPMLGPDLIVYPSSAGQLVGVRPDGTRVWQAGVPGQRLGRAFGRVTDVSGDPVLVDGVIYAGNATGQTVALRAQTGERLWSADDGAMGPPVVAGGSVFVVNEIGELVRLDARDGTVIWRVQMPYLTTERPRRIRDVFPHYGPVLAGGRLWVASGDGALRGFDPASGAETFRTAIPGGAASLPAAAQGALWVVTQRGQLVAFR
jgi:outer membrane protein assembly factor BamB